MSDLNDPRVLFAAERTLLAWTRTSLTLMTFGFMIERFGLFLLELTPGASQLQRTHSFWIGLAFITVGALVSLTSLAQYRTVLRSLKPSEIPEGYRAHMGVYINLAVAMLGLLLIAYLFLHGPVI